MKFRIGLLLVATVALHASHGQQLTRQDTLRGTITPERKWWDVLKYDVSVEPDYSSKTIRGSNVITFKVLSSGSTMQIDLQEPMQLDTARLNGESVRYERNGNVYLLSRP